MVNNNANNIGFIAAFRSLPNVLDGPKSVLYLGGAGWLPFICIPAYLMVEGKLFDQATHANLTYGAIIFTYLGAVRWGFGVANSKDKALQPTWANMTLNVAPSCFAWLALLVSQRNAMFILGGGFLVTLIQDVFSGIYGPWYKSFRLIWSSLALMSISVNFLLMR